MKQIFELAKYHGKWAVYGKLSMTFTDIGKGKKYCIKKVKELNNQK